MIHRGIEYTLLTKDYHPVEGEILYKIDEIYNDELPPLEGVVTHWGATHHDDMAVQVKVIYPQEILDKWVKAHGKKILKELREWEFWWLENMYKRNV